MAENYGKPNTVTDSSGRELVSHRTAQGIVLGDGINDNLTLGFQKDRSLGLYINDGTISFIKLTKKGLSVSNLSNSFISIDSNGLILNDGTNNRLISIDSNGLILNDGTNNRLILGVFPDGTIGLIISRTGTDIYNVFA